MIVHYIHVERYCITFVCCYPRHLPPYNYSKALGALKDVRRKTNFSINGLQDSYRVLHIASRQDRNTQNPSSTWPPTQKTNHVCSALLLRKLNCLLVSKGLSVPAPRVQPNCLLVSEGPLCAGSKSTAKLSTGVRRASGCRLQEYSQIVGWCPKACRCRLQEYSQIVCWCPKGLSVPGPRVHPYIHTGCGCVHALSRLCTSLAGG